MASRADSARIVLRWLRDKKPVMLGADMDYDAVDLARQPGHQLFAENHLRTL